VKSSLLAVLFFLAAVGGVFAQGPYPPPPSPTPPMPTRMPSPTPPSPTPPMPTRLPSPTPPGSPTATPTRLPSPTPPSTPGGQASPTPMPTLVLLGEPTQELECYRACAPDYSGGDRNGEWTALPTYSRGYPSLILPDPGPEAGLALYMLAAIVGYFARSTVLVGCFSVVSVLVFGPAGGWLALLVAIILVAFRVLDLGGVR